MMTCASDGYEVYYDFVVSEDGETATISARTKSDLVMGAGPKVMSKYGSTSFSVTMQVDLTGDKPVVTDCMIAQDFDC